MLLRSNISQSIHSCNENPDLYTLVQGGRPCFHLHRLYHGRNGGSPSRETVEETSATPALNEDKPQAKSEFSTAA